MKIRLFFGIAAAVFSCILLGCKTTIPVTYTEPARLNLSGVKRIAIDSNNPQVESSVSKKLIGTGVYTVASAAELSEWKQWKAERRTMEQLANYQARAIEVSAADLVEAYTANAVRADSSYQRKTLRITAVVKEIGKSSRGSYFVRFAGAGNDSVDVYFLSSEINRVANVDKGQTITII
ncbi:MAG: OB-fold putative lipoprotein, partial [Spirochaetaceae bacterium]|nr:OB-fold putative lipoprotein [Spirochaetaceae bacterium]